MNSNTEWTNGSTTMQSPKKKLHIKVTQNNGTDMAEAVALAREVLGDELQRFLQHLAVEKRLAARTLAMYREALVRLQRLSAADGVDLRQAQAHHLRGWVAALRGQGLAPRSIALALSAWRGLYRWWGRDGLVRSNPAQAVRAPRIDFAYRRLQPRSVAP